MVKLAGSDTTNHNTLHSNDTNNLSSHYTLDKTSQSFINVKDIINTTNIYKNMDFTILAATLAMSIAAPLINGLIQKAINRWNDQIPLSMQQEADNDMNLLAVKLETLQKNTPGVIDIEDIPCVNVKAEDFLNVQRRVAIYLTTITDIATKDIVEGFCKKDKPRIARGEALLLSLQDTFGTSIKSAIEFDPHSHDIGHFQYDHALEALSRIIPSAMVCTHHTFLIRRMIPVTYINKTDDQLNSLHEKVGNFYNITSMKMRDELFTVYLVPRIRDVPVSMMSELYGLDLTILSNAHFFSMKDKQEWYTEQDPNLSIDAILENKLGHSVSVLGEVADEIATHASCILMENNPHDDVPNLFLLADKGPFKCKIRMRQFGDPLSLFNMRSEDDILSLDRNFKTMTALIRVCGLLKVHYPKLIRRGDRNISDYVFRSKLAGDSTFKNYILPTAPIWTLKCDDEDKTTRHAGSVMGSNSIYPPIPGSVTPNLEKLSLVQESGLDELFKDSEFEALVPKGLISIREIPTDIRKKIKLSWKSDAFKVSRMLAPGGLDKFRIIKDNSEFVHEVLCDSDMKPSYEFRNQLWYITGNKLFDNSSRFFNETVIRKSIE